jgi:hypothetical protein
MALVRLTFTSILLHVMTLISITIGQEQNDEDSTIASQPSRKRKRNLSLVSNVLEDLGFSEVNNFGFSFGETSFHFDKVWVFNCPLLSCHSHCPLFFSQNQKLLLVISIFLCIVLSSRFTTPKPNSK